MVFVTSIIIVAALLGPVIPIAWELLSGYERGR